MSLTLKDLKAELAPVRALLDGMPTAPQVEALHEDVDRVQGEVAELSVRVAAIEGQPPERQSG